MNAKRGRTPRQYLIVVNVTFTLTKTTYTYLLLSDGLPADDLLVATGDQVGWYVRVQAGPGWSTPAYELEFEDPTIFGTDSISVPDGGMSGYFTVLALSTTAGKYTLAVSGVSPVSDPQIQVNPNGNFIIQTINQVSVRWTPPKTMEYQANDGPWLPFPDSLPISIGDKVVFQAEVTQSQNFEIIFQSGMNPRVWASPFDLQQNSFPEVDHGQPASTKNLPVCDENDPKGTLFQFVATLADGSAQSDPFTFELA